MRRRIISQPKPKTKLVIEPVIEPVIELPATIEPVIQPVIKPTSETVIEPVVSPSETKRILTRSRSSIINKSQAEKPEEVSVQSESNDLTIPVRKPTNRRLSFIENPSTTTNTLRRSTRAMLTTTPVQASSPESSPEVVLKIRKSKPQTLQSSQPSQTLLAKPTSVSKPQTLSQPSQSSQTSEPSQTLLPKPTSISKPLEVVIQFNYRKYLFYMAQAGNKNYRLNKNIIQN